MPSGVDDGDPSDREVFRRVGLFFNENWDFENSPGYKGLARASPATEVRHCEPLSIRPRVGGSKTDQLQHKDVTKKPSIDLVSVVGRLSATRRGYTDAGSVQARAGYKFSAVAHQSVIHRRRVGGARMRRLAALNSSQEYKVSIVCSTKRYHTTASVIDGMSNTLMIAENVRTGYDPNSANSNWGSCSARRTKFYFSHRICQNNVCPTSNVDFGLANSGAHAINSGKTMPEGESPWPNSFHPGGVSVGFADGRAQFLNESIDGKVFYNLMTPQGMRLIGTPLDAGVSSDHVF